MMSFIFGQTTDGADRRAIMPSLLTTGCVWVLGTRI
jgi:hypothetical protein